ncbi:MAG: YggS family pyridoxal phosphate-dependent enzyme [Anaerolineaceae bacterium]|nr:YggS family pyridoxal phosphate-dependent enzyme [Anaerolineaceae bacterium]
MLDAPEQLSASIQQNLERVRGRIAAAAAASSREPDSIRVVVVTKTQPVVVVEAAIAAGARCLGENYPEEAVEKIAAVKDSPPVEWHMIGHLQSRKVKLVVDHFHMMHSLDSLRIAERLERVLAASERKLTVLLEFNVGGEYTKFGWVAEDEAQWERLLPEIEQVARLPHLVICGLMTMPPLRVNPEDNRMCFARLRRLRDFLSTHFPHHNWRELSMGTSSDYEVAVTEGATLVRIGQAILGPRDSSVEK